MGKSEFLGKIVFINHEKNYADIEYEAGGKQRSIKGLIDIDTQRKWKEKKLIKKTHHFMVGDMVSFIITEAKNGKNVANNICFLYNNALDNVINKAAQLNSFKGYLKLIDGKYFVKEVESYVFFPVAISPWQILPTEKELNDPVNFSLDYPEKKDKAYAQLQKVKYKPEYKIALQYFKEKTIIPAQVARVSPHNVYLNVVGESIQAKLSLQQFEQSKVFSVGDIIEVRISFINHNKIAIEKV